MGIRRNKDIIERRLMLLTKSLYQSIRSRSSEQRIFVAGMQRSGTNMVMDVLERSFDTDVYHEHDSRAFHDYELRDNSILHGLVAESNAPVVVLKALLESDLLPELMQEFAPAKAIWVVRSYQDVVNSAKRSFPHLKRTIRRIVTEPGNYWQSRGALEPIYDVLKSHYKSDLSLEASVALFWYARSRLYFEREMDQNPDIKLVKYEQLVTQPAEQFEQIFGFIDLPFEKRVIAKVHARSISRHQPPLLPDDIRLLCDELEQQYRDC